MKIFAILLTASLYAMTVSAGTEYFSSPKPRSVFKKGTRVTFALESLPELEGHPLRANLYREGGDRALVYTMKQWTAASLEDSDDGEFKFDGLLSRYLPSGFYYVQLDIVGGDNEDPVKSYTFGVAQKANIRYEDVPIQTRKPAKPAKPAIPAQPIKSTKHTTKPSGSAKSVKTTKTTSHHGISLLRLHNKVL
ncbi:hypothetical protein BX666DRAFT_1482727 [Dichotomocladium elegans]|nr:hypothetical protein BX666DRAFT_1482727 [Dichotomocladium elegans]